MARYLLLADRDIDTSVRCHSPMGGIVDASVLNDIYSVGSNSKSLAVAAVVSGYKSSLVLA